MNSRLPRLLLFFLAAIFSAFPLPARAVGIWHRDYASGLAEAKAEGKKLLVVFTGTDWIEICEKFYDEILGDPAFIEAVSGKFALVKLEFPQNNQLPRGEAAERAVLREAYRVRGFPTVILADAEGRPFGINGYQPVTAVDYAGQILAIEAAQAEGLSVASKAGELDGMERAKALSRAIPDLPGGLLSRFYRPEMEAVLAADPEDTLKLGALFRGLLADAEFNRQLQLLAKDAKWEEMIALTDRHIEEQKLTEASLQGALLNRAGFEQRAGKAQTALETLRRVVSLDPESDPGLEAARILEAASVPSSGVTSERPTSPVPRAMPVE
ncbi:MAG: thioredoxin family protein [Verrucomicrobiae bacterium]|nr:thioredoxin family protein [Verrucomicrobiae bacterium]